MKRPSILISAAAGTAGRPLLRNEDIDLSWALTEEELRSTSRRFDVVLTREELAEVALSRRAGPVVVLLEANGWSRHEQYFDKGATALVQASIEAVSELTGVPFEEHPWVEVSEFVSVFSPDEHYVRVQRVSPSGMELEVEERNFARGQRISFEMEFLPGAPRGEGTVVRAPERHSATLAVAFDDGQPNLQKALSAFVHARPAPVPEPVSLTSDLGTCTLDLMLHTELDRRECKLREQLRLALSTNARVPRWVNGVAAKLTETE